MKRTAILVIAALAAGTGLGYLLGPGKTSGQRAGLARAPIQSPPQPESFKELIDSVAVPDVPSGSGAITGHVRTTEGDPVSGARITAVPSMETAPVDGEVSLVEAARREIARRKWYEAASREARTDDTGSFTVSGLGHVPYSLRASHELYTVRGGRQAQGGETVDFVATPIFTVAVDVLMPDGSRPDKARIRSQRGGFWWSSRQPRIRMREGKLELFAVAGEHDEFRSEAQELLLERGVEPPSLVFRLMPRTGIRGKVLMPEGVKLEDVYIYALGFAGEDPPAGFPSTRPVRAQARDGFAYAIHDLEPGRYQLAISVDRRSLEATEVVDVPPGGIEKDLVFPAPDPARYRTVRVLGPDGAPLREVRFSFTYVSGRRGVAAPCNVIPGGDGEYRLRPMDFATEDGESGTYTLRVHTRKHGYLQQVFDPRAPGELVVRVADSATVKLTLDGYAGSGHEDQLYVAVKRVDEADRQFGPRDRVDPKGRKTLGPVQSGDAEVLVGIAAGHLFWTVARNPVRLRPGENRVTVPTPALHPLRIVGKANERFRISPQGPNKDVYIWYVKTDKAGECLVPRLAAGRYELSGYTDGKRWALPVTVPSRSEVRFP